MAFNKVTAEKQRLRCQESTSMPDSPSNRVISRNILVNNNMIGSLFPPDIFIVNKLLIMLIFKGVVWYNVFIEYIFSSKFIIN